MNRQVELFRSSGPPASLDAVVAPWVGSQAPFDSTSRRAPHPSVALVPSMTHAQAVKASLLSRNSAAMGIQFVTPGRCWLWLRDHCLPHERVAGREDLHLLLSLAAADFPDLPSAHAVAMDPSSLMRALDALAAAGWSGGDLDIPVLEPVLARFDALLKDAGLSTAQHIDRQLRGRAAAAPPLFGSLLVYGFDGRHWPLWPMLRAAVCASTHATVCLTEPRHTAAEIDRVWVDTWEQEFGEARPVDVGERRRPFASLAEAIENGQPSPGSAVSILIGNDTREQAAAIAAQALIYAADPACRQLAILFPGPDPTARETARRLSAMGVPYHDGLGHNAAPEQADMAWREWLQLQEKPRTTGFLAFIEACPEYRIPGKDAAWDLRARIRDAYDHMLVDDLPVLFSWMGISYKDVFPCLAERAPLGAHVDAACRLLATVPGLGGEERADQIRERFAIFPSSWAQPVPREIAARWLAESTDATRRQSDAWGGHPYARIHLLPYDKADGQSWTHLILTSLNRNQWPPEHVNTPFLSSSTVEALNRRAVMQGPQGEGQIIARKGKGLVLGPTERLALVRRQFLDTLESCSGAITCTASCRTEAGSARIWAPSDLLIRLVRSHASADLTDARLEQLQRSTRAWLARVMPTPDGPPPAAVDTSQTVATHLARRNVNQPFGPYDFGLLAPADPPPILPCTAWERALSHPDLVWMERYLGVSDSHWSPREIPWPRLAGLWVHRWMRDALSDTDAPRGPDGFLPTPTPDEVSRRLRASAAGSLRHAADIFSRAGRALPHWWQRLHDQAFADARRMAELIGPALGGNWDDAAVEVALPANTVLDLLNGAPVPVTGRIDLLLRRRASEQVWVIDFKTGAVPSLTPAKVAAGEGLQVLLYALAFLPRARGGVSMSLARPGDTELSPVDAAGLAAAPAVRDAFRRIGRMHHLGIFGSCDQIRPEYGMAPAYPLATVAISPEILHARTELTFGAPDTLASPPPRAGRRTPRREKPS